MRYLVYLMTLLFSTAVAQNPTILQGNYISNVFGQSNFVKNPNAQTGTGYVSSSSATVTRSTTTPLVATSEFNWTASAGGFSTWSTRPFDAGMKNQNCEARFTYRGFTAGTTTAQVRNSGIVIAELVLTPSATDPRIASINFPCGDLSLDTNFRLLQSGATLGGINEIGGIYVGLATNMANVAQAQAIFRANDTNGASIPSGTPTSVIFPATIFDADGGYNSATGYYTIRRAGRYQIHARVAFAYGNPFPAAVDNYIQLMRNGSSFATGFWSTISYTQYPNPQITSIADFNVGDQINVAIQQNTGGARNLLGSNPYWSDFTLTRFPSSSELVVTPERQNTFGEISGTNKDSTTTSASFVTMTGFPTIYANGKCLADGTNMACKISTLPLGSYKVDVSMPYFATAGAGGSQNCQIQIKDNKGSVDAPTAQAFSFASQSDGVSSVSRTFHYTSVQTDVIFSVQHKQVSGAAGGICGVYTTGNKYFVINVTPLDQPSNSALYVQGPVKAAATGAAIPEGYVNEFATRSIADTSLRSQSSPVQNTLYFPWTDELTLPAGNWMLCYKAAVQLSQNGSSNSADIRSILQNKTDGTTITESVTWPTLGAAITNVLNTHSACRAIAITASKTFRVGVKYANISGTPTVLTVYIRGDQTPSQLYAIRLN